MLFLFTVGCDGVKHVLQIEEPLDHTQGDDGGKLKYKISLEIESKRNNMIDGGA